MTRSYHYCDTDFHVNKWKKMKDETIKALRDCHLLTQGIIISQQHILHCFISHNILSGYYRPHLKLFISVIDTRYRLTNVSLMRSTKFFLSLLFLIFQQLFNLVIEINTYINHLPHNYGLKNINIQLKYN